MKVPLFVAVLALTAAGVEADETIPIDSEGHPLIEAEDEDRTVPTLNVTVDHLEGLDIHNPEGQEIAEVEEILTTADGEFAAVTADVGGFLGIGSREVVVPIHALYFLGDRLTVDMSEPELAALPLWDD